MNHAPVRRSTRHLNPALLVVVIVGVVLLAAACGPGSGDLGPVATPPPTEQPSLDPSTEPTPGSTLDPLASPAGEPSSEPTPPSSPHPGGTPAPVGSTTVRAYFFLGSFVENAGLAPVLRVIPRTQAVGAAAMAALLAGPSEMELGARPAMYTVIPEGTRFLGLRIGGGIATVNLSAEFESGGGSASVLGRLAQVVYTLTQFPTVTGVKFELDGVPVTVFSGEGVALDSPVDRSDYTEMLPAVFLDRPAWGGVPNNPMHLAGMANTFEAVFHFRLLDAGGHSLANGPLMASCGTGCWGTFDLTIPYSVTAAGWGTLQVWEPSAVDGSVVNLTEYPVWLTP